MTGETPRAPGAAAAPSGPVAPPAPEFKQFGDIERKPMNKIAKTAANNLSFAWQTIPHVTQHDLADITELEAGRKRASQNKGVKITMTVLAIKAVVAVSNNSPTSTPASIPPPTKSSTRTTSTSASPSTPRTRPRRSHVIRDAE